ncbi:MAG: membrane protein-like protein [uncultured Chloroflexi bacterium]|uniref:Membrane protein-like protein n=1 Tax=uncultured Chloroflexota bacterium TaxID=166587 RepID=A0A6J4ISD4_9CHLR|nr:MAG: membrane protein-like protein [uncultured Chloroflexota bacterium]
MESKAKLLGHPVHPMLIVFPLGLWIASLVFDVVKKITGNKEFSVASFWAITGGLVGGMLAAVFGWIDWFAIPRDTRAKAIGLWHGVGNMVVAVMFGVSWMLRMGTPGREPGTLAFTLSVMGISLGGVTGWLGGELVDRLGVGVDPGAHLNSTNALSHRPAHENDPAYPTLPGAPQASVRPVEPSHSRAG